MRIFAALITAATATTMLISGAHLDTSKAGSDSAAIRTTASTGWETNDSTGWETANSTGWETTNSTGWE